MMVACLFLAVYVGEQALVSSPTVQSCMVGVLLLCLVLGAFALLWFPLRLQKRLGLVCPKCQKLILPISTVVIATSTADTAASASSTTLRRLEQV